MEDGDLLKLQRITSFKNVLLLQHSEVNKLQKIIILAISFWFASMLIGLAWGSESRPIAFGLILP